MLIFLKTLLIFFNREKNERCIVKDQNYEKEQEEIKKIEYENFLRFRDQMIKFREDERKYRLSEKLKQIQDCEELQVII